jgi:SpoVK/Ycf46/Vps4 family AAA+-type ATPase
MYGHDATPPSLALEHLDAVCRWAEALADLRTGELMAGFEETRPSLEADLAAATAHVEGIEAQARARNEVLPLVHIGTAAGLAPDASAAFRLAVAPALDTAFRRRVARYYDNILLDAPTVDFILAMLYPDRVSRMAGRRLFQPGSPLVDRRLVALSLSRDAVGDALQSHEVRIPDRLLNLLLGADLLDRTLAGACRLSHPDTRVEELALEPGTLEPVLALTRPILAAALPAGPGVCIGVRGPSGTGKTLLAEVLATTAGRSLITVDCGRLASDDAPFSDLLETLFQEARFRNAVLAFDAPEAILGARSPRLAAFFDELDVHSGVSLLLTGDSASLDPMVERHVAWQVETALPDPAQREAIWRMHVARHAAGGALGIPQLALDFEFTGAQIRNAVRVAAEMATSRGAKAFDRDDLTAGAWAQVRADMAEYARRSKVRLTLDDLVLPDEEMRQVRDLLDAARHRAFIMTEWGFGRRLTTGKGLACLLLGEPGTGKTLCAEILAVALGQNLYQISIPRVMSKYIGETEKNIERIFATARANNSILLFDEADALFSTRVKVETSVDRFSNMEINLLLQEIERYEGLVLLTTNLEKNIDKAFERRIQFKIRFPFPDAEHRAKIWQGHIPRE